MAPRILKFLFKSGLRKDSRHQNNNHHPNTNTATAMADDTSEDHRVDDGVGGLVVELYSSHGCPTSLEAELLISRLGRGDFQLEFPVTILAFHVDYWDYNGWKDPYGSSQWTVRQKAYVEALELDTLFTPQIVVQGRLQCIGNEEEALLLAISHAPRFPPPAFQATFQKPLANTLQVSLTGALRSKVDHNGVHVMVALHESGLVTNCPSGVNKDQVLSNDFVVRRMKELCFVKDVPAKKTLLGTINFSLWEGFTAKKSGLAVFVENNSHHIFGCQNITLPNNI